MIYSPMSQAAGSTGQRIERDEALLLLTGDDLLALGGRADTIRRSLHPENRVTFVIDRNVNYTNICETKCSFCAFYRDKTAADAYVLTQDAIFDKIDELVRQGGTQLLMQGGLNPELGIDFFEELFGKIKARFPGVQNHSLSPAEVVCIAKHSGLGVDETISRLKNAGLDSIPGGGAEILVDRCAAASPPKRSGGASGLTSCSRLLPWTCRLPRP